MLRIGSLPMAWFALTVMSAGTAQAQTGWRLVWADEFDGPTNSAPNPAKWVRDLGQSGWGNKELENYTNSTDNAFLDGDGFLDIAKTNFSGDIPSLFKNEDGKFF